MLKHTVHGDITHPALIFLHGFLGAKEDWHAVIELLADKYFCVAVDLPGHGGSEICDAWEALLELITTLPLNQLTLVGYSMGGRLALQLSAYPAIILSAHPGLDTEEEKAARWQEDLHWIALLENFPIDIFLDQWYQQSLFNSLRQNKALFERTLLQRKKNDPFKLAAALRQMSLAKQEKITAFHPRTLYVYGEEDLKYEKLSCTLQNQIERKKITNAGHAIHLENPEACAQAILTHEATHADT